MILEEKKSSCELRRRRIMTWKEDQKLQDLQNMALLASMDTISRITINETEGFCQRILVRMKTT